MKKIFLALLLMPMVGCASPKVIEQFQANDTNLSCEQLKSAIAESNQYETDASHARGITATNVAAAIIFPPALLQTNANAKAAMSAARERRSHLEILSETKSCPK